MHCVQASKAFRFVLRLLISLQLNFNPEIFLIFLKFKVYSINHFFKYHYNYFTINKANLSLIIKWWSSKTKLLTHELRLTN